MNKTLFTFVGGVLIISFVFFAVANALFLSNGKPATGTVVLPNVNAQPSGEAQVFSLSSDGLNYTPSVITVEVNRPVRLIGDVSSLPGCLKAITIPAFGVRKVIQPNDNVIEFTPTQVGTFSITCTMGMGRAELKVVQSLNVPNQGL